MRAEGGSSEGSIPRVAAPEDAAPASGGSSAAANGGLHGAATSNDVDPFAETDAALHSNADSEVLIRFPCLMHLLMSGRICKSHLSIGILFMPLLEWVRL